MCGILMDGHFSREQTLLNVQRRTCSSALATAPGAGSTAAIRSELRHRLLWGIGRSRVKRVEAAGEAVALYRELTARNPDAFQPDLARSLNNLSVVLSNLGQREAALEATREAVELYRALATRNPDASQSNLAAGLEHLDIRLGELGRHDEALAVRREVEQLRSKVGSASSSGEAP
jgi:tetratricopeptide (TPR) repeat protein